MRKFTTIIPLFFLISCAHHRDVRPNASGEHLVSFKTDRKNEGHQNAIRQANHFCEQEQKRAYIVKEESKYTGSIKESEYENRKTAAKIVKGVGSGAWVVGGKKESSLGGLAALGGQVADEAIGKGYLYRMTFQCK